MRAVVEYAPAGYVVAGVALMSAGHAALIGQRALAQGWVAVALIITIGWTVTAFAVWYWVPGA